MDKKNLTIGVLLLAAAFAIVILGPKNAPQQPHQPAPAQSSGSGTAQPATTAATPSASTAQQPPALIAAGASTNAAADKSQLNAGLADDGKSEEVTLRNDFIEVHFTPKGGAIKTVGFKKYDDKKGSGKPYEYNKTAPTPLLAFGNDSYDGVKLNGSVVYELAQKTDTKVVYTAKNESIEITRTYTIQPVGLNEKGYDPYQIHHEITFKNLKERNVSKQYFSLNVGTALPDNGNSFGPTLAGGYYDGEDSHFIDVGAFSSGGFLGLTTRVVQPTVSYNGNIKWAAVSNQFFTSILTAKQPGAAVVFSHDANATAGVGLGISAVASYLVPELAGKDGTATLAFDYYVGPKEYTRLASKASFPNSEADVMQYANGWYRKIMLSGAISPFMNWLMTLMHKVVGQWGIAIILMTLLLKVATLPFTLAASRSAKRMQKIQPEMQALREKYKDNPQKQQKETMELFRKHKVNPMGGCLPILITMPLFVAFFFMLQGIPELRYQGFLWAGDLSSPDTIWRIPGIGIPLNIMPLLMGATMLIQMRLTPSPTVDNAQAKMMKIMPVFFTFICYNFSCALALYSTVNGLFTIGQQLVVNKMKDKEPAPAAAPAAAGKRPMKNVTPAKKK